MIHELTVLFVKGKYLCGAWETYIGKLGFVEPVKFYLFFGISCNIWNYNQDACSFGIKEELTIQVCQIL